MPPADSRSLTCLQDFLNLVKNRPKLSDIPSLPESLLLRTRNSRRHSPNNNDLLEFLGDRCVNLATALLVDAVRINKDHHMAVRRVICNNDTFGRLSFHLHLHEHAALDAPDRDELDKWNPLSKESPPKVLADLFEAYAGAVYLQHGWKKLYRWLRTLFEPIIKVATCDFWYRDLPRGIKSRHINNGNEVKTQFQSKFLDYLGYKGDFLADKGRALTKALPASTNFVFSLEGLLEEPHCDEIEVASHLLCMWICKTFMRLWPRYHQATAKAPHLATTITAFIVNDVTMADIASAMDLAPFMFFRKDQDKRTNSSAAPNAEVKTPFRDMPPTACSSTVLASSLKAAIGIYYRTDPAAATDFGMLLLHPLVLRAHDIAVQDPWYRPVVPPSAKEDQNTVVPTPSSAIHDPISALIDGLQAISIASPSSSQNDAAGELAQKDSSTNASSTVSGSLPRKTQIPTGPAKFRLKAAKGDDVADLVGQLQSLGLAETSSGKAQKKLALDDIFDRGLPQEDSENDDSSGNASPAPSKSTVLSIQSSRGEKGSENSRRALSSSNDNDTRERSSARRQGSSGKWRPIGETGDVPQKPELAVLSNSTNLSHILPSTTKDRSSSPCSSSGSHSADVTDSGYASPASNSGSVSPTNLVDSRAGKPPVVVSKPPSSLFVPRQVSKKSTGSVRSTSGRAILKASSPSEETRA